MPTEHEVEGLTGKMSHFIIEPFFPHAEDNEMYIAIRTLRQGDEILFSHKGGINVGDVESHAHKCLIEINADGTVPKIEFGNLFDNIKVCIAYFVATDAWHITHLWQDAQCKQHLPGFVQQLYAAFCHMHFAFLEINPFSFDASKNTFAILDSAAKLDHTAEFLMGDKWKEVDFPSPFGRKFTAEEQYIRDLDATTGASLKLTVLNPKGRIWTMIAGGGASVVYSDTICDLGMVSSQYPHKSLQISQSCPERKLVLSFIYLDGLLLQAAELANYGEYSGAPSTQNTYDYAKTILNLMTAEGTKHPNGKILLIGGGIANFTSVASTFTGIIKALREFGPKLLEFGVRIYVRRGGPDYQNGLKLMRNVGEEIKVPMKVYGPETYVTDIIPIALADDTGSKVQPAMQTQSSSEPWHEVTMEEAESNANFQSLKTPKSAPEEYSFEGGVAPTAQQRILFSSKTTAFVWGLQSVAVQEMLDFDNVCGRKTPSVAGLIYEFSPSHMKPFYWGAEEIYLPVFQTLDEAVKKFPEVDTLVNFASMRSADKVTKKALDYPQIKTIAVIAEGVPERRTRELIRTAQAKGVTIIGPATVGGIKPGCFRIGNTGGKLENIMNSKLYRPGSVAFVTKSGGMLNEMNNILRMVVDGTYEGVAIGGDRFPGTTMMDHILRYEVDPHVKIIVVLGEVGGDVEYEVARALEEKRITKPVVAWCVGTCAPMFSTEVSFGHAGAWAGSASEHASAKNQALKKAGATVPASFQDLGKKIQEVYKRMVAAGVIVPLVEPEVPTVPMDYAWAKKLGYVRKPKGFMSTISDDRGEELVYAGYPISRVITSNMGVGGVLSLLWFKRPLPEHCYKYLEYVLMLTADHGPAVCGAHNTVRRSCCYLLSEKK